MDTQQVLMEYVREDLLKGRKTEIKPGDDLLSAGILDSLGILQMVAFIEEHFGYQVPDEDVVFENFVSVEALTNYLKANQKAG